MTKTLAVIVASASMCLCGSATAKVFGETKTSWIIEMDTEKRICTMSSWFGPKDKTGTYLMILAEPALKEGLGMAIMNGGWTSLRDSAEYELELQLNSVRDPWRLKAKGLNRNGWLGIGIELPNSFVTAFRTAEALQVFHNDKKLDAFALKETTEGLNLLYHCSFQLKYVERPADPFK